MNITLNNFAEQIESRFVLRGIDYWLGGSVLNLKESKRKENWTANVQGTELYKVKIELEEDTVINHECTCPFDSGDICKHIIAVLLALKPFKENKNTKTKVYMPDNTKESKSKTKQNPFSISLVPFIEKIEKFSMKDISKFDSLLSDISNETYDLYEYVIGENKRPAKSINGNLLRLKKEVTKLIDIFYEIGYDSKQMDRLNSQLVGIDEGLPKLISKIK